MKHLVIIGLVLPEPASTAAGTRMLQLIRIFRKWNYQITFLSAASPSDFSEEIDFTPILMNDSGFDELIQSLNPDIVLFDRYVTEEQFGWRVAENVPNAIRILDTEDLHFLREARRKAFTENRNLSKTDFINTIFKREIASILRCDLSLIISKFEFELLTNTFKINKDILFYIPFVDSLQDCNSGRSFDNRTHFVSIGNFLHEPNWQTVLQLKTIWKNIKTKLPKAELHIYGAYAKEKVWQLHDEKSGFIIKGRASSVQEIFSNYKVLLAPIPFGAGLKGKLWESMKFGLPNVTTSIGAEGMTLNHQWNGFIEDDLELFCEKAAELYSNSEIWKKSQETGFLLCKEMFNEQLFEEPFQKVIENVTLNLEEHRFGNYLGQILQHHSLNSTKYMSRWIEEKNKGKS